MTDLSTLERLVDEKLKQGTKYVAKVAVYFISYILDRTHGRDQMSQDPLFIMVRDKLTALAFEEDYCQEDECQKASVNPWPFSCADPTSAQRAVSMSGATSSNPYRVGPVLKASCARNADGTR